MHNQPTVQIPQEFDYTQHKQTSISNNSIMTFVGYMVKTLLVKKMVYFTKIDVVTCGTAHTGGE